MPTPADSRGLTVDVEGRALTQQLAYPARIRLARDLRALTQQETVARMADPITTAALSQIEAGRIRPTSETLVDLAQALDVPVGYFLMQLPGGEKQGWLPQTYFRDRRATPSRERRRATAVAALVNDLLNVVEHVVRLPDTSIPSCPVPPDAPVDEVEEAAAAVRQAWRLGDEPIPHVVRELERHGIPVARLAFGTPSVDAFSIFFGSRPLVVLAQDKHSYVRSRFDAAHELGHLVMHRDAPVTDRAVERQAHDFASVLLMPRSVALRELPRRLDSTAWRQLAQLKARWGISMAALLYRASSLGLLDPERYRAGMKYMSMKGWRTAEPGDRELGPAESPLLVERALESVVTATGHSIESFVAEHHLPLVDTLQLVEATVDARPVVEL